MKTRQALAAIDANLDESMGVRQSETYPSLSPEPHEKDVGRRPLAHVGTLDVEQVVPDPNQPRMEFTDEAIDRLAASIREKGQLSPIRVRWSDEIAKWIIVAGERRWRATKRAGLSTIHCYFHEQALSESHVLEEQLIENCLREDLLPIEEARAFEKLIALNGWNARQVAEALRVHPSKVSRALSLLRLPEDIQDDLATGKIPGRIAHEISKIDDPVVQRTLAARARDRRLTHAQAASTVRQRRGKRRAKSRGTKQTFLTESGWRIVVSTSRCGTYDEIEEALIEVLEEVRHRIDNNVQIF